MAEIGKVAEEVAKQRQEYVEDWMKKILDGFLGEFNEDAPEGLKQLYSENRKSIQAALLASDSKGGTWSGDEYEIQYTPDAGFYAGKKGQLQSDEAIVQGLEFTPIDQQEDITPAICIPARENEGHTIVINGEAVNFNKERIGSGENSGVFAGEQVVVKVLVGRVDEEDYISPDSESAKFEHIVGGKYKPDGDNALSIGVGEMQVPLDSEFLLDVFGGKKEALENFKEKYRESDVHARTGDNITVYVLVQRKVLGQELGKVEAPPKVPDKITPEMLQEKIEVALAIIQAIEKFQKETDDFHMDIRPENILLAWDENSNKPIARLIDPGAAANYEMTRGGVGVTDGFSHPEIVRISKETNEGFVPDYELGDLGYESKHEAYAVRAVMRFMGIDKMIDMLSTEADRVQFLEVRAMLQEQPGQSNDMTLELMSKKMQAALVQKQENVSSDKAKANSQSPPPSPEQPAPESIPTTPSPPPAMTTAFNRQDSDTGQGSQENKESFFAKLKADWEAKSKGTSEEDLPTPEAQSKKQGKPSKGGKG